MTVSEVQEFGSWQFSLPHLVEFLIWKVLPRSENMNFGPWNWAVLQVKKFVIYLLYSHRQLTSRDLSVTVFSWLSLDLALTLLVLGNKTRVRLATLVYLHSPPPPPLSFLNPSSSVWVLKKVSVFHSLLTFWTIVAGPFESIFFIAKIHSWILGVNFDFTCITEWNIHIMGTS